MSDSFEGGIGIGSMSDFSDHQRDNSPIRVPKRPTVSRKSQRVKLQLQKTADKACDRFLRRGPYKAAEVLRVAKLVNKAGDQMGDDVREVIHKFSASELLKFCDMFQVNKELKEAMDKTLPLDAEGLSKMSNLQISALSRANGLDIGYLMEDSIHRFMNLTSLSTPVAYHTIMLFLGDLYKKLEELNSVK